MAEKLGFSLPKRLEDILQELDIYRYVDAHYKVIKLVDAEQFRGMTYFLPILDRSNCLSKRTEFTNSFHGSFKKIVLKDEKVWNKAIIRVDDLNNVYFIIRFDLAESLLSRKVRRIKLEEVLVDT